MPEQGRRSAACHCRRGDPPPGSLTFPVDQGAVSVGRASRPQFVARRRRPARGGPAAGAVGAALVLLAAGRPWVHAVVVGTPGQVRISPAARSVAPAVSGLGLFALASVVAVVATRRAGRLLVGSLAALAGLGILAG